MTSQAHATAQIHVWSDYVCPFCLIADELIDRAVADQPSVQVVHHPWELRPHPTPTLRPEDPYLPDIWQRAVYPMARRYGVPMTLPTVSPQPYTEPAFRGAQYAADRGVSRAYHRRLLTAFFQEDQDIGERTVLTALAAEIGLDGDGFTAALDDPRYAAGHREALAEGRRLGITVVPTILVGGRRIDGVATEDVLRRALGEAA